MCPSPLGPTSNDQHSHWKWLLIVDFHGFSHSRMVIRTIVMLNYQRVDSTAWYSGFGSVRIIPGRLFRDQQAAGYIIWHSIIECYAVLLLYMELLKYPVPAGLQLSKLLIGWIEEVDFCNPGTILPTAITQHLASGNLYTPQTGPTSWSTMDEYG